MATHHSSLVSENILRNKAPSLKNDKISSQRQTFTKRTALGDVGNKLASQNQTMGMKPKNDLIKKSVAVMGPPEVKTNCKPRVSIKNTTVNSSAPQPVLKRQESLFKKDVTLSYSSKQLALADPDEFDKKDPQMVTEYLSSIFSYLRHMEDKFPIREKFLENHQSSVRMRSVLINWLVEVHMNFKLCLESLHLSIAIVDRYLQDNKQVGRQTLQLVGATAMLVASKFEEMYMPDICDFVYVCDDTFSAKQILAMERDILKKLEFNLGRPLSIHFLRRYNKIAQVRAEHHSLGKYILELALLEYDVCYLKPSLQAAAACCLAIAVLNGATQPLKAWTPTLVLYTTYKYSDFKSIVHQFANILIKSETSKFQAIRKKYASSSFNKISMSPKLQGPLLLKLASEQTEKK